MQGIVLTVTVEHHLALFESIFRHTQQLGEPREHACQHEVTALVPQAQDGASALWRVVRLRDARGSGRQRHMIQHVRALV